MSDVLDLFGISEGVRVYTSILWLYGSTNGVISLGGSHTDPTLAEQALAEFTQEALVFREILGRDFRYCNEVYKAKRNVALVMCGDRILREAELPRKWFPPGDPRGG